MEHKVHEVKHKVHNVVFFVTPWRVFFFHPPLIIGRFKEGMFLIHAAGGGQIYRAEGRHPPRRAFFGKHLAEEKIIAQKVFENKNRQMTINRYLL